MHRTAHNHRVVRPAVAWKNGSIVVSFREFFADDRFSILIRVRKE